MGHPSYSLISRSSFGTIYQYIQLVWIPSLLVDPKGKSENKILVVPVSIPRAVIRIKNTGDTISKVNNIIVVIGDYTKSRN